MRDKDNFIRDSLIKRGMKKGTAKYFVELSKYFEISNPLINTTEHLAELYACSERSIQRYVKELKEEFGLISIRHHWNNTNPDKPYIEYNTYTLLESGIKLIEEAKKYASRYENVFFMKEKNEVTSQ